MDLEQAAQELSEHSSTDVIIGMLVSLPSQQSYQTQQLANFLWKICEKTPLFGHQMNQGVITRMVENVCVFAQMSGLLKPDFSPGPDRIKIRSSHIPVARKVLAERDLLPKHEKTLKLLAEQYLLFIKRPS